MPFLFCLPGPAAQRAQDGSPIRRAKNARSRRPSAPPATSPQKIRPVAQKFGPTTRHAMPLRLPRRREKVRSATRRAMPQADRGPPKRAPYGSHAAPVPAAKILLLAAAPRPHRPARHISAHNPANRAKIGQHPTGRTAPAPPQKQSGSSAPPSQSARPRPYGRGARFPFVRFVPSSSMSRSAQSQEPRRTIAKTTARGRPPVTSLRKVLSATRRAMPPRLPRRKKRLGQPPCRAHRPSPATKIVLLVAHRTPRPHRPACRAAAKSPAKHPTGCAPSQRARPPPVRAGGAFPFVRFVPSSENGRSAQSQRQAPHDRQNNSAAACQAAHGRMNHSA